LRAVSSDLCEQIADFRRKLRKVGTHKVLFLDETALRLNEAATRTVVVPGEQPYILATETSSYARRYDMIACTVGDRLLLPKIYSPQERSDAGVKGINGAMLLQFIDDTLAQAVEGLDRYPLTLVLDRAPIHTNLDAIRQAFHDRGSQSIANILLMPPNAAKRLSPLDNSIFHDWKEEVRKHCPATATNIQQLMNDALERITPAPHYKHCGLMRDRDVYFDCPAPALHRHSS
jgi:hypothetical protein